MALVAAVGGTLTLGQAVSQTSPETVVDLGEQGLSEGDTIDPYFEEYFESGVEVRIPGGSYEWNGSGWGQVGNAALIGDGNVELHRPAEMNPRLEAQHGVVTVKNLTVRGKAGNNTSSIRLGAHDPDALLLVENFNLPDGSVDPSYSTGVYVPPAHSGVLVLRDCHIEGFADNGLYASTPGGHTDYTANDGAVVVDGGLYKNNNISNVRIGSSNSIVQNATIVHDGSAPTAANGAKLRRGLRVRQAGQNLRVVNCDIVQRTPRWAVSFHSGASGGSGVIEGTRIHNDASDPAIRAQDDYDGEWVARNVHITGDGNLDSMIPLENSCQGDGCQVPDDSPHEPLENGKELVFAGTDTRSYEYSFTTTGRITPRYEDSDRAANPGSHDYAYENDDGTWTAEGSVPTGSNYGDTFVFEGSVESVQVSGDHNDVTVLLDGEEVSIEELIGDGSDGGTDDGTEDSTNDTVLSREIRISGGSRSEQIDYTFTVSEAVAKGDRANSEESVSDTTASGYVIGGTDSFDFAGEITSFDATGDLTVTVDGSEVDQSTLGGDSENEQTLPNGVTLSGGSMDQPVEYELTVSEAIAKGDRANSEESVSDTTASGYVIGGTDSFDFAGEITSFSATGDLTITVNGEEVAQEDLGSSDDGPTLDRTLTVSGGSQSNQVDYSFTVSEAVAKGERANSEESVDGASASGYVVGGTDSFDFAGEVTAFDASDAVTLTIDGQTVDPAQFDSTDDSTTEEPTLDRTLSVSGGSLDEQVNYSFSVSEAVAKGEQANSEESVSGTSASGYVVGGTDSFEFAGEVTSFEADDDVTLRIDGSTVDPANYGDTTEEPPELTEEIRLSGGSVDTPVNYSFTVSEAVAKGDRANSEESVSGTTASGYVVGGTDSFDFAGEITSFEADGDLTVTVNGSEVDL